MKQIGFTLMLFVVVLSPLAAVCQRSPQADRKTDWTEVQILEHGLALNVKWTDGRSSYCRFDGATQDLLFCDQGPWVSNGEYRVERKNVKQLRLASRADRVHKIVTISTAAGVTAGLAYPTSNSSDRIESAVGFGFLGFVAGGVASIPEMFIPGKLVYRQPKIEGGN